MLLCNFVLMLWCNFGVIRDKSKFSLSFFFHFYDCKLASDIRRDGLLSKFDGSGIPDPTTFGKHRSWYSRYTHTKSLEKFLVPSEDSSSSKQTHGGLSYLISNIVQRDPLSN